MKYKKIVLVLIQFIINCGICGAQGRNSIWCFGDSVLVDFTNATNPTLGTSGLNTRGSSVSISDTIGSLLFCAETRAGISGNTTRVYDTAHNLMTNGDSIVGEGWYQELLTIPMPSSDSLYYLFSIGVAGSSQIGFYCSIIDMNANGGLGAVIQKNVQLENFKVVDGMNAVKHGNGRDWWIIIRNASVFSTDQYLYYVGPGNVSTSFVQSVGTHNSTNSGRNVFSKDGSKLAYINFKGMLELYDFDRCTGIISNPVTIHPEPPSSPFPNRFWSCEFSANSRFLYVSTNSDSCHLYQYDLLNVDPVNSRILLEASAINLIGSGFLKRGPDQKVYFSRAYECVAFPFCYPYPDSVYNYVNMNLSVINSPDSLGLACNYTPYSFYLGGKRTYYGLPNNPDYDLPALAGSPCDTLVSIYEPQITGSTNANIHVYYAPDWEKAFINASNLKGRTGKLLVYDMQGKVVHSEPLRILNGYYTRDLSMIGKSDGMYVVVVQTDVERLVKKVMVD